MHKRIESYRFFRKLRHLTFFYIFFPTLLYTRDFIEMPLKSLRYKMVQNGSLFNKIIKSFVGILATWILTWVVYAYLRYQVQANADKVAFTSFVFFIFFLIVFSSKSKKIKCIILLILPFMATNRGRSIFLMRSATLTVQHVVPNILTNFKYFVNSYQCNQELMSDLMYGSGKQTSFAKYVMDKFKKVKKTTKKIKKSLRSGKRVIYWSLLNFYTIQKERILNIGQINAKNLLINKRSFLVLKKFYLQISKSFFWCI